MANFILVGVRATQAAALFIAILTLALGLKRCHWLITYSCDSVRVPITQWSGYNDAGGLYFVFFVSLIFFVISIVAIVMELMGFLMKKWVWLMVLGSGAVLLFICFVVEIYYASGSGISWKSTSANVHGKAYISARSWIATCVFLFVAFVCYIADILFVTMINRQTQQTTVVRNTKINQI